MLQFLQTIRFRIVKREFFMELCLQVENMHCMFVNKQLFSCSNEWDNNDRKVEVKGWIFFIALHEDAYFLGHATLYLIHFMYKVTVWYVYVYIYIYVFATDLHFCNRKREKKGRYHRCYLVLSCCQRQNGFSNNFWQT